MGTSSDLDSCHNKSNNLELVLFTHYYRGRGVDVSGLIVMM